MEKNKLNLSVVILIFHLIFMITVINDAPQANNQLWDLSLRSSNEIECTYAYYQSSSITIQFGNFSVIKGPSQIKYDFYKSNNFSFVNITFILSNLESENIVTWKYTYKYEKIANCLSTVDNVSFGNFHLFINPEKLEETGSNIIISNYNNQSHIGEIENSPDFQNYYTEDHILLNYTRITFFDDLDMQQDLYYEKNSGFLLTQSGKYLFFGLFPNHEILSCGGIPYHLEDTDLELKAATPYNEGLPSDIENQTFFQQYGLLLFICGLGLAFIQTYRIIKKRL